MQVLGILYIKDWMRKVLIQITKASMAKQTWDVLKIEYQGSSKVLSVKLYFLRQELEIMKMKCGEKVQDYITRVLDVIYQLRMLGEFMPEKAVVAIILRSLSLGFKHVVSFIV